MRMRLLGHQDPHTKVAESVRDVHYGIFIKSRTRSLLLLVVDRKKAD